MATDVPLLRTSERSDFKRCPQRWWWSWREGLAPMNTPQALWFGQGIHLVLAHHYCGPGLKRGREPMKVWRDWAKDADLSIKLSGDAVQDEKWVKAAPLGEAMLDAYFTMYGKDEHMWVIAPEQEMQIQIPHPTREGVITAIYCGTFDLVYRNMLRDDKLWLEEHKTAAQVMLGHLPLDDQAGSYWAFCHQYLRAKGIIKPREMLEGIEYNFLRKALPDERPTNEFGQALNKDGTVSKRQPTPRLVREPVYRTRREQQTQIRRVQAEAAHMAAIRAGDLPLYKTPRKECAWDCGFFNMCQLHDQQADWKDLRDYTMVVRDPYADHRKSTEG